MKSENWLLSCTYQHPSQSDQYYTILKALIKHQMCIASVKKQCQQEILRLQLGKNILRSFYFNMSLNDKPTFYRNQDKPSCVDFNMSCSPLHPYKSDCLFTGLGCHKLVLSVFKIIFSKSEPKEIIMKKILINNFAVSCLLNWLIIIAHLKMYFQKFLLGIL